MKNNYTHDLVEIATFGFENIDENETVEVNLKDLMYVYSTLQEYMRFFHQPSHYQTLKDVEEFLGSVEEKSGFKLLHSSLYEKMQKMIPDHINEKYGNGEFDSPKVPFYYEEKS